MMRKLRAGSLILMSTVALAINGCQTPQASPRPGVPVARAGQQSSPFLNRQDYPLWIDRAVEEVLRNHRFTIPWIAARGADGVTRFVAERFQAVDRFDRIYVRVPPEDEVTASITAYQFHGSDWAILGRMFVGADYRAEAESIAGEIRRSLSENIERVR